MRYQRWLATVLAAGLLAGCSAGAGSVPSSVAPGGDPSLNGSSAARHILANVPSSRTIADRHRAGSASDYDDGGWSELALPQLVACGSGVYSTNCALWSYPPTSSPNATARSTQTVVIGGGGGSSGPPVLDFCAAQPSWTTFLADDGATSAPTLHRLGPVNFSVKYLGTQTGQVVAFATNPLIASLTGSFSNGNPAAFTMTPAIATTAGRGWLLLFTWSWPADVLAIPYSINEIQLAPDSGALTLTGSSNAKLAAFDCLGDAVTARTFGKGVSVGAPAASSLAGEFISTVSGGASSAATILLTDAAGASAAVPVNGGATRSWGPDL